MKTKSEEVFEAFLTANNVQFKKIEEVREKAAHRPDYLITLGNRQLVFELKELAEDENLGVVKDLWPSLGVVLVVPVPPFVRRCQKSQTPKAKGQRPVVLGLFTLGWPGFLGPQPNRRDQMRPLTAL